MATHPTTFVSLGSRPSRGSVFAAVALALAIAGSGIAAYLASQNLQGETGVCTITHGCSVVQKSAYGRLFGVPVSVPGLGLYIALAVAAGIRLSGTRGRGQDATYLAFLGSFGGLIFSAYLTWVEAFVLDAWCIYCIASALIMAALFATWTALAVLDNRRP
ncbi:MAG TPA: vitamin K epoxide reductase family protein [Tepidiformaceae bacterium]|nr:vitamin K epoxide reductase family protein [Tepidiformaceae bacterium]